MNGNFKTVTLPLLAAFVALVGLIVGSHVTLRDDLGARIQKVQDDVNILREEVRSLDNQVSNLRERVAGLEVRVGGLEVRMASLEMEVRSIANGRAGRSASPAAAASAEPLDPMA